MPLKCSVNGCNSNYDKARLDGEPSYSGKNKLYSKLLITLIKLNF